MSRLHHLLESEPESMLKEDLARFTLFPIQHPDLWALFKKHERSIWHAEEIDYAADIPDWIQLSAEERFFIENILAFFSSADGIVMENLMTNFFKEVQIPEARAFYSVQGFIEQVHSETYSLLIDNYCRERKAECFSAIKNIPCITKKAEWAMKWMDPTRPFAERLVAFAVVEGVFFSGSFCAIFWLKSRGLMTKALGKSNEFIARDENLHCEFAVALYNKLVNKLSQDTIHEIFRSAYDIEQEFITESLPCKLIGMNSKLMSRYIKYVCNFWISKLITNENKHCKTLGYVKNPFSFMDSIGIESKNNFFEGRTTEYARAKKVSFNDISDIEDF